jgi:hypothetical protein
MGGLGSGRRRAGHHSGRERADQLVGVDGLNMSPITGAVAGAGALGARLRRTAALAFGLAFAFALPFALPRAFDFALPFRPAFFAISASSACIVSPVTRVRDGRALRLGDP